MNFYKQIFYKFLILLFVISYVVYAKEVDEEEINYRELELGFHFWNGYHAKDRFESQLGSYRSSSSLESFRYGNLTPIRKNSGFEALANYRIYTNWKGGIVFGTGKFNTFEWREYDTLGDYTFLSYTLSSDYLFITATYEWFFRKFSTELGGGLGVNTTALNIRGYTYTNLGNLFDIQGNLLGNGLSYRIFSNINLPVNKKFFIQLGISGTWHSAPYFGGNWNEKGGTLVLREDGSITGINLSTSSNNLVSQNAVRRLDMFYGYFQIHIGGIWRIRL